MVVGEALLQHALRQSHCTLALIQRRSILGVAKLLIEIKIGAAKTAVDKPYPCLMSQRHVTLKY